MVSISRQVRHLQIGNAMIQALAWPARGRVLGKPFVVPLSFEAVP